MACMRHEHEEGRAAVASMDAALDGIKAGREGAGTEFAQAAGAYTMLLRNHIAKENQILFPMAEQMLAGDVKSELLKTFAGVEEHDIGHGEIERLVKTLETLAAEHLGKAPA